MAQIVPREKYHCQPDKVLLSACLPFTPDVDDFSFALSDSQLSYCCLFAYNGHNKESFNYKCDIAGGQTDNIHMVPALNIDLRIKTNNIFGIGGMLRPWIRKNGRAYSETGQFYDRCQEIGRPVSAH